MRQTIMKDETGNWKRLDKDLWKLRQNWEKLYWELGKIRDRESWKMRHKFGQDKTEKYHRKEMAWNCVKYDRYQEKIRWSIRIDKTDNWERWSWKLVKMNQRNIEYCFENLQISSFYFKEQSPESKFGKYFFFFFFRPPK